MKHIFILFSFFISIVSIAADVNVTSYGAIADGKTVNTLAIQNAIDACSRQGGGRVIFPKGIWVSGTILLKNDVHLFLDEEATLLGSTDISDYQLVEGFKDGRGASMGYSFIGAKDVSNTGIRGKGKINGNGKLLLEKHGRSKRPFLVRFVRCTNVIVSDVQMEGPAAWTMHFFECKKVIAERIIIRSRGLSNNDGIDIDCSQNVIVRDCDIDSGDDAICLKATGPLPTKDVEIYNCKINTNQGAFKLGTESVGNFENINIHDCTVDETKGIKLYSVDGAHLKNLSISNITINKTTLPILIRLGARLRTFREGDTKKPVGIIDGINIKNISVKQATQMAVLISGIPGHPVKNVNISNLLVHLPGKGTIEQAGVELPEVESDYPEVTMFGKNMPAYGLYIRHGEKISMKNITIKLDSADARPAIVCIDQKDISFDDLVLPVNQSEEPLIRLRDTRNASIKNIKTTTKPLTFLKVEGSSDQIILKANKPSISLGNGVKENAVRVIKGRN